jgi:6-phospho-beta-glucosidase
MPRLVVLGGSGASTPELADALVAWPGGERRRPPLTVVLQGRSADKLALVAGAFRARLEAGRAAGEEEPVGGQIAVETASDLAAALQGADIVLVQVRVGGLAARVFDETFPRAVGIPGEETMGPGGFANALRTVPALAPAWEAVARVAPDALVVNLTNPAGIVVAAAARQFGLRAVGVCDSPVTLTEGVAAALGQSPAEVRSAYVGGNHAGWWVPRDEAELTAVARLATGLTEEEVLAAGALPAPYGRYYLAADRILAAQGSGPSRAEQLQALEAELLASFAGALAGGVGASAAPRRGAAWYPKAVIPLLDAWWNGDAPPEIVGLVTDGTVPGIPAGVVVERTTDVTPGRLVPRPAPPLPPLPAAILAAHAAYEGLVVEALAAGAPRRALVRALAANPMVRDVERAGRLVDAILAGSPAG